MAQYSKDYVADIIDEIALEGLDGITLQALWLRLSERPNFIFNPVDDHVKKLIWKIVVRLKNLTFYELPTERGNLITFKRKEHIDAIGNFYEPEDMPDCIYPHCQVEDNGTMGSCSTYKQRVDITNNMRNETYEKALSLGNKLVIVANQISRSRAICSNDFNPATELGIVQYCILERTARARYEGEVTQGKRGLQLVTKDPKMLYYFRKLLVKNKLVQKQVFYMRVAKQTSTGSLIHLPRFYSEIKSRQDSDALKLINYLEQAPLKLVPMKCLKSYLNIELKKLLAKYPKNFKTAQVPYRLLHPTSKPNDWKLKSTGEEKSVRVVKLLDSNLAKDDEDEDDDDEEVGLLDESQRRMDRSLMRQAYHIVEKAGPRGIKQSAVGNLLAVPSLQARSICKHLVKRNLVRTALLDVGRQRITHFYSTKFVSSESSLTSEMQEEKIRLLEAINMSSIMRDANTTNDYSNSQESIVEERASGIHNNELAPIENVPLSQDSEKATVPKEGVEEIQAEIIISKHEPSSDKPVISLTEEVRDLNHKESSSAITARMLKRASVIVQSVNNLKVIQDTQKVQRIISEAEELEGLKQTVDRKTIQRLLDKLEADGLLKTIRVNLKGYGREKTMLFICHPLVNESHSEIQSAIEQAKMKLPIVSAHHTKKNLKKASEEKKLKYPLLKYELKAGRKYGYKPKFVRMRILHTYMYYLIYGYDGDPNLDQECKQEIVEKLNVDRSVMEEMSFVYRNEVDWKMFLPPLPVHAEYSSGWCLLSDVLLRLPLNLFVSIVNVSYNIPGLMEYIEHPIKRYFLVKHLPSEILHYLTLMRKYIFVVSDIVARLGYIGLIQMGPQKLKEKDQVFIYLNRNAILYNTIPSDVGYNHISQNRTYECIKYTFNSIEDVIQYWYDLSNFAMNTNLGNRNSMTGQPVVVESVTTKKELVAAVQPKSVEEARVADVGYLPGDNLGAGGLDSDMFVHLKRNWYWTGEKIDSGEQRNVLYRPVIKRSRIVREVNSAQTSSSSSLQTAKPAKTRERESSKHSNEAPKPKVTKQTYGAWKSRAVSKKKTRILRQRKTKFARKPYYDQKDKDALSRMVKLRVDWSPTEDNLLLICKVASLYMSPEKRRQVAKNFCAVREILHSTYPAISRNKTSRACQRRMHYMMKNPSTAQSVYLCLEEIKQDQEIHAKFHRAVEKVDDLLKAQGEGPKGYQQEYDKIFMNLVTTLLKKLKTVTNNENALSDFCLPNSVAEFEKKYKIIVPTPHSLRYGTFNEVHKTVDILASVINAVIHSSLCCTTDKTSYSHQLFYIYQQYSDKLLRYVMSKCRSMSIVSCRKRYKRWKQAGNDCLPLASSPYQLSITYIHILQSKYQYNIFSECYNGFKAIMHNSQSELTQKDSGLKQNPSKVISFNVEVNSGGECANIVELFSSGLIKMNVEFPDQLIVLDPRISETEESYKLIMKRFKEMLNIIKDSRKKEKKTILSEDDDEDFEEDKNQADEKEPYFEQFNLKNKTGVANTASRLALYLMRDEPLEQLDNSLQHAHDFFVLNPCKVTVDLNVHKAENAIFFKDTKSKIIADIKRLCVFPGDGQGNKYVSKTILEMFPEDIVMLLLDFIESKGDLGATIDELMEEFSNFDELSSLVDTLVDDQFILRAGVVNIRYIHNKFSKPWLVRSFFLPRLTRDSMDTPNTNSAYAISFGDIESLKRKNKPDKVVCTKQGEDKCLSVPLKKRLKFSEASDNTEKKNPTDESKEESDESDISKNPEELSPPAKKVKFDDKATDKDDLLEPQPSTSREDDSREKSPEKEQSRFVMRTQSRRWVPIPSENMKRFNNLDPIEKNIYVKVRPWIKIDGTLNRRVLDRLLGSVLGHCLTCPGISVQKLQERFTPALQPVHTFELLEILVKIECVKFIQLTKPWKCSLFSERAQISTEPSSGFGNRADIVVDPCPLAVSRLGYFIGDKNYTIDYLDALTGAIPK